MVVKRKSEKNPCLNRKSQTHDLCDAGVVFYQLSYQANWELVILCYNNNNNNNNLKNLYTVFSGAEH